MVAYLKPILLTSLVHLVDNDVTVNVPSLVGVLATAANVNPMTRKLSGSEQKAEQMQSPGGQIVRSSIAVVPSRVPCGVRHSVSSKPFIFLIKLWLHCSSLYCLFGSALRKCSFSWKMSRLAATLRLSSLVRIRCWEWSPSAGMSGSCASMHQVNKIITN